MIPSRRLNINFYTNVLALVANVCVGIYYTPYLVNTLGLIAYGILPLALIINQYISIATQTFTHSFTRFYSVAIQQDNYDEASKDISTSLVVVLLISCLVIPLGLWISYNVDLLFQIPAELLTSAKYLFLYTILSFIVSMFSSLLNVTLYAINRLDLMNVLKIIRSIFKLIFVILFFQTIKVDVIYVGIANLLTELIVLLLSVIMFYRYKPSSLSISYTHFDKAVLHSIMAMSIWVLIQLDRKSVV